MSLSDFTKPSDRAVPAGVLAPAPLPVPAFTDLAKAANDV